VLYVGDDIRDCQAAAAAGCGIVYLTEPGSVVQLPLNRRYCSRHRFLTDAVEVIRKFYGVEDGS
jgi:histidinol phosphatase-like enzyme